MRAPTLTSTACEQSEHAHDVQSTHRCNQFNEQTSECSDNLIAARAVACTRIISGDIIIVVHHSEVEDIHVGIQRELSIHCQQQHCGLHETKMISNQRLLL
jgi:hypothetical protein